MRRSILTSLVIIGAVLALVMGAGTFAVFTDEATLSSEEGGITSGQLDLVLTDDGSATSLTFELGANQDCTGLADGDSCTTTVVISHGANSDFEFTYAGAVNEGTNSDPNDCFVATLGENISQLTVSNSGTNQGEQATFSRIEDSAGDSGNGDALDPGESESLTLTVTLSAPADNTETTDVNESNVCQNQDSVTYDITVKATQSSSPRD